MTQTLLWQIIELMSNFVDSFLLLRLVTSSLSMKYEGKWRWIVYTLIFTGMCSLGNIYFTSLVQLYILLSILLLIFTVFLTDGSLATKIFWTVFTPILFFGVDMLNCDIALRILKDVPSTIIYEQGPVRLFLMIITRSILALIVFWLRKKQLLISYPALQSLLLLLCPIFSWIALMMLARLFAKDHVSANYLLFTTFLFCAINAVYIYLFISLNNRDRIIRENALIIQRMNSERRHLRSLQEYSSNIEKREHYAKKHFRAILDLAQDANDISVISYVKEISGLTNKRPVPVDTGNLLFDSLIGDYANEAVSKGIHVSLEIQVPVLNEDVSVDLCSVVGNLWENAIEGCERVSNEKTSIVFTSYVDHGHFIMELQNSCSPELISKNGSSKTDGIHGLGIKIIEGILEKNNGFSTFETSGSTFVAKVALPLKATADPSIDKNNLFYWESK